MCVWMVPAVTGTFMSICSANRENGFTIRSMFNRTHEVTLLLDYSHVVKRIRNNIFSSGTED